MNKQIILLLSFIFFVEATEKKITLNFDDNYKNFQLLNEYKKNFDSFNQLKKILIDIKNKKSNEFFDNREIDELYNKYIENLKNSEENEKKNQEQEIKEIENKIKGKISGFLQAFNEKNKLEDNSPKMLIIKNYDKLKEFQKKLNEKIENFENKKNEIYELEENLYNIMAKGKDLFYSNWIIKINKLKETLEKINKLKKDSQNIYELEKKIENMRNIFKNEIQTIDNFVSFYKELNENKNEIIEKINKKEEYLGIKDYTK